MMFVLLRGGMRGPQNKSIPYSVEHKISVLCVCHTPEKGGNDLMLSMQKMDITKHLKKLSLTGHGLKEAFLLNNSSTSNTAE